MSNILILSENEVFKEDLSDQIKHHIPDFEVTEDKDSADIIVVDENADILKSIEKNIPVIFLSFDDNSSVKAHTIIQKPFVLSAFLDAVKSSINIFENSDEGNLEFNDYILYSSRKEIYNNRDKSTTKLTEREVSLIKYLYKNAGKIVSKNDLYTINTTKRTILYKWGGTDSMRKLNFHKLIAIFFITSRKFA